MKIEEHDRLVNFDVVRPIHPLVPIDEALIAVVVQRLKGDDTLLERTLIPSEDIHALAEICLKTIVLSIPR